MCKWKLHKSTVNPSPTRRALFSTEKAFIKCAPIPYKTNAILEAITKVKMFMSSHDKKTVVAIDSYKMATSISAFTILIYIYLKQTKLIYLAFIIIISIMELQLLLQLIGRIIVTAKNIYRSFFSLDSFKRYILITQIGYFLVMACTCILYSNKISNIWYLVVTTLLFELIELIVFICVVILLLVFCLAWLGEFFVRLMKCKLHFRGYKTIDVSMFSYQSKGTDEDVCIICQGTLIDGDKVCQLCCGCKVEYHKECLLSWYNKNNSCPICKQIVPIR